MNRPKWMSDPTIAHIPEEKLDVLSAMFEKTKGKSKNELLPFMMAMGSKMKGSLSFTPQEMQLIIAAIKRASSTEEQREIETLLHAAAKKINK